MNEDTAPNGNATMNENQQRIVQAQKLYYDHAAKYNTKIPTEAREILEYDLKHIRMRPKLLKERYEDSGEQQNEKKGRQY